jgi:hypothetical protein
VLRRRQRLKFPASHELPYQPMGYQLLAERCWAQEPHRRPSFAEVLQSLGTLQEAVGSGRARR